MSQWCARIGVSQPPRQGRGYLRIIEQGYAPIQLAAKVTERGENGSCRPKYGLHVLVTLMLRLLIAEGLNPKKVQNCWATPR